MYDLSPKRAQDHGKFRGHTTAQQNLRGWKAGRHLGSTASQRAGLAFVPFPFRTTDSPAFSCNAGSERGANQTRAPTARRHNQKPRRRHASSVDIHQPTAGTSQFHPVPFDARRTRETHRDVGPTESGRYMPPLGCRNRSDRARRAAPGSGRPIASPRPPSWTYRVHHRQRHHRTKPDTDAHQAPAVRARLHRSSYFAVLVPRSPPMVVNKPLFECISCTTPFSVGFCEVIGSCVHQGLGRPVLLHGKFRSAGNFRVVSYEPFRRCLLATLCDPRPPRRLSDASGPSARQT